MAMQGVGNFVGHSGYGSLASVLKESDAESCQELWADRNPRKIFNWRKSLILLMNSSCRSFVQSRALVQNLVPLGDGLGQLKCCW